jgi:hypothetical protein
VVSVGTGKANAEVGRANLIEGISAINAVLSLKALMEDCADQVETLMQWVSRSPTAREIDREIGTAQGGPVLCSYLRYNVHLKPDWCEQHLGERLGPKALKALEAMDDPDQIPELDRVGRLAGQRLVRADHFTPAFDLR